MSKAWSWNLELCELPFAYILVVIANYYFNDDQELFIYLYTEILLFYVKILVLEPEITLFISFAQNSSAEVDMAISQPSAEMALPLVF